MVSAFRFNQKNSSMLCCGEFIYQFLNLSGTGFVERKAEIKRKAKDLD